MTRYGILCDQCNKRYSSEVNKMKVLKTNPSFKTYCTTKCFEARLAEEGVEK